MQINPLQDGNTKSLSRKALPIVCSGKHATGKANRTIPNNIGQQSKPFQWPLPPPAVPHRAASVTARLPPMLERSQWDICANILTKPLLSPTKISPGLKSMKGNFLSSSTCASGLFVERRRGEDVGSTLIWRWPAGCCYGVWRQRFVDALHSHSQPSHMWDGTLYCWMEKDLQLPSFILQCESLCLILHKFNNQWLD